MRCKLLYSLATLTQTRAHRLAFVHVYNISAAHAFTRRRFNVTLGGEKLSGVCGHYHADH